MKIEKRDDLIVEMKRTVHKLEEIVYKAYIDDVEITRESFGKKRLKLLLRVPVDNKSEAYLETSVPLIAEAIHEICMSTAILDAYSVKGFHINDLLGEDCFILVEHQYEYCDKKTVVTKFLEFGGSPDQKIKNIEVL
jgi:hypothetical protein